MGIAELDAAGLLTSLAPLRDGACCALAASALFWSAARALAANSTCASAARLSSAADSFRASSALRFLSLSLIDTSLPAALAFGIASGGRGVSAALGGDGIIFDVGIIGETPGAATGCVGGGSVLAGGEEGGGPSGVLSPVHLPHVSSESPPEDSVSLASQLTPSGCPSHRLPCRGGSPATNAFPQSTQQYFVLTDGSECTASTQPGWAHLLLATALSADGTSVRLRATADCCS